MKLALIVAMDEQGMIGKENDLPWRLSADLQYFKRITMGKPILMGRNTHESIGRPLPGRRNLVITRQADYQAEGCEIYSSIESALAACADQEEVMIMGGASIYEQTLALAERLYITQVHAVVEGDTHFPTWSKQDWRCIQTESHSADEKNEYDYSFNVFERIQIA
jgi:dihydrofolate reductase